MKKFMLFFLLISLISCATSSFLSQEQNTMDSWIGADKITLIQTWGPPNKITPDGQGGEIYIYDKTVNIGQFAGSVYAINNGLSYTNPIPAIVTRSRMFYINPSGKIYHWISTGRQGY